MSKHPRLRARLRDAIEGPALAARLIFELAALLAVAAVRGRAAQAADISGRFSIRPLIASISAIGFGVIIAVTGAGTTFAFLNAQGMTSSSTVQAGNASLTVSYNGGTAAPAATIPDAVWTNMLPGDVITQQVTVANPSAATFAVASRLSALGYYEVRAALGDCGTAVIPAAALTTTATALTTLASGASAVVCIQVKLPTSAPSTLQPGSAGAITPVPFTLVVDGTQVQS